MSYRVVTKALALGLLLPALAGCVHTHKNRTSLTMAGAVAIAVGELSRVEGIDERQYEVVIRRATNPPQWVMRFHKLPVTTGVILVWVSDDGSVELAPLP